MRATVAVTVTVPVTDTVTLTVTVTCSLNDLQEERGKGVAKCYKRNVNFFL